MRALLAIIQDTWRQSKQQLVFLLLAAVMVVYAIAAVLACKVAVTPAGTYVLVLSFQGETPAAGLEVSWDQQYKELLAGEELTRRLRQPRSELDQAQRELVLAQRALEEARLAGTPPEQQASLEGRYEQARQRATEEAETFKRLYQEIDDRAQGLVDAKSPHITPLQKGIEIWLSWVIGFLVYICLLGFIAASAGYFPAMLAAGAIDIVIAKPLPRLRIFLGKYLGGLALLSVALLVTFLVVFFGIGFRTGVWPLGFFLALPVMVFQAALLYAVVAAIGIFTRSTPLAIVIGYLYYLVVEWVVWGLQQADQWLSAFDIRYAWVSAVGETSRWVFPGFGRLRAAASAAVLNVPVFDWQPLLVGTVWLAILLGASYWRFERTDF